MSFWKNRPLIITIILIIILVVLLFSTSGEGKAGSGSVIGNLLSPVQGWLYGATSDIGDFFSGLFSSGQIKAENAALQEKVAELEGKLRDFENIAGENERLKELLNVKELAGDYDYVTASVIGKNPGVWFREFTVNVGSDDGILPDMIVLSNGGLLGRVVSVGTNYAKVMTLIDTDSGVPAVVDRTRDNGVVRASQSADEDTAVLQMYYLSIEADIIPGDKILTSGIGGIYPKGLYVGQVSEVSGESATEKRVLVQSDVDFEHVEEVLIIRHVFEEVES